MDLRRSHFPLRRVEDVLRRMDFFEVQLRALTEKGPHYAQKVGRHIAALQKELDQMEAQLRERAQALGMTGSATASQLRAFLLSRADRRQHQDPTWSGPERRQQARRKGGARLSFL